MPTPSEQLLTRTVYATDGVTTNWDFSFSGGYLDKSHVKAVTEAATGERTEIIVTEAMIVGPFQVRIAPALAAGLTLTVYRDTPKDLPLVDFTDESGFSEIALDTNAKQAVFIAAETTDTVNTSSSYDAEQAASSAAIAAAAAQVSANAAAASALLAANEADASAASAVLSAASAVNSANSAASSSAAATTVFNANTTAYTRTLLDDATAVAARATLGAAASGANTDITSLGNIASINGGQLAGMRNRIINGACNVAQRAALAYPNNTITYSGPDRFFAQNEGVGGQFTQSQSTLNHDGIVKNAVRQTVNTGIAGLPMGTNSWAGFVQFIEGGNCYDLKGKPLALSFVFNTNVTGTYSISLRDSTPALSYVASFAATANTPTRFTFAAPANASLTLPNSTARGLSVVIGCLNGATYQTSTLNAWQAGNFLGAVGATNWAATTGNFIELTELQLELGSVATPFEHRPYGLELALCQRYYEVGWFRLDGYTTTGQRMVTTFPYAVPKRALPTVAFQSPGYANASGVVAEIASTASHLGIGAVVTATGSAAVATNWTASAEL